ncbi:MAG: hypothetical protein BGN88_10090 [Clostridiales bacterium 43-6]|nr:MAG: hypothetical protein BGN88_10090 [Clostridiales bacterium 43-6]
MKTDFDHEKLHRLLEDFYISTGQRIAIFDVDFRLLSEHPNVHSPFCAKIRTSVEGARRCRECDIYGMKEANKTGKTVTYRCHAGILEVCSPIIDEEGITGFLMFGQVLYDRGIKEQREVIWQNCKNIMTDTAAFSRLFDSIRKIPADFLLASANIMTACVGYIRLEQMMKLRREDLWGRMKQYIETRYHRSFHLSEMAADLSVSVSTLCKTAQIRGGKTVGQLVTDYRMERAKFLLTDIDLAIAEIAGLVGIEDYNYFSRLFRKETGESPTAYRKQHHKNPEKA